MEVDEMDSTDLPVKDGDSERSVPGIWRPTIRKIVNAFVGHDYELAQGIVGVDPISSDLADGMRRYIEDYGAELTDLPEDTWKTSVCIWMGNRWEALIDLWTVTEGRSDLVLHLFVRDTGDGDYKFSVHLVYVP